MMPDAEADLASIWWYGYWNFGLEKTERYIKRFYQRFDQLAEHELGHKRADLGERIFALPHREHAIFYQSEPDNALVLRVLHHSQDAAAHIAHLLWL